MFLRRLEKLFLFPPGYVGAATVGAAAYWFLYDEEGPQVTYYQLVSLVLTTTLGLLELSN